METQLETVKKFIARTQRCITDVTRLSLDEQNKMMFEAAYEWLDSIGCHGNDQTLVTSTKQFWGFWKTEWNRIDILFLNFFNTTDGLNYRQVYEFYHNPKNPFLQGPITQSGYHQAIKKMRV